MIKLGQIALLLLLCATTVAGFLLVPPAARFPDPGLARIIVFHVPCSLVATLASIVAGWYAFVYLRHRRLEDDIRSRASFALALLFWGLTTVTGAIFAKAEWGAYWNWDIKQGSILMLLLIFCAYFALRSALDNPRKAAALGAAYALFALLAMPFLTYVLPNATPDTLHPKHVLDSPGALSPEYALVLWAGTLGLSLVYVWAWRLQVALETVQARLDRRGRRLQTPARLAAGRSS